MNEPDRDEFALEGVAWPSEPLPSDELRAALLKQTSVVVRRRALRGRIRMVAGWAFAYAAGIVSAWLAWPREPAPAAPNPLPANLQQIAATSPSKPKNAEQVSPLSPEELRRRVASAPRPEQIRLLRLAGDRYLFGRADVESALDCYRQVIELTPRAELAQREADDSWLLAELKSSAAGNMAQFAGE